MNDINLTLQAGDLYVTFETYNDAHPLELIPQVSMDDIDGFRPENVSTTVLPEYISIDIFNLALGIQYNITINNWLTAIITETEAYYYTTELMFNAASVFMLKDSVAKSFIERAANDGLTVLDLVQTFVESYSNEELSELYEIITKLIDSIPETTKLELLEEVAE